MAANRLLFVTLVTIAVSPVAAQQQVLTTGDQVLPACIEGLNETSGGFAQGICLGVIRTLAEEHHEVCLPEEVTVGQYLSVVVKYLDGRPTRLHERFVDLALEALMAAWPCRRR